MTQAMEVVIGNMIEADDTFTQIAGSAYVRHATASKLFSPERSYEIFIDLIDCGVLGLFERIPFEDKDRTHEQADFRWSMCTGLLTFVVQHEHEHAYTGVPMRQDWLRMARQHPCSWSAPQRLPFTTGHEQGTCSARTFHSFAVRTPH